MLMKGVVERENSPATLLFDASNYVCLSVRIMRVPASRSVQKCTSSQLPLEH